MGNKHLNEVLSINILDKENLFKVKLQGKFTHCYSTAIVLHSFH